MVRLGRALVVAIAGTIVWAATTTGRGAERVAATPDFYVATNGNDDWSGRLEKPNADSTDGPFATIARARDAIREVKQRLGDLDRDLVVQIRGGVYRLDEPLVFGSEDSGVEPHSIIYAAYPGETPVLSGGRVIGGWTRDEGELWTAEIPAVKAGQWHFRQLYVGGRHRPRARSPEAGFFRIVKAETGGRTRFTFRPGDLRNWKNLSDVEAVILHDWAISRMKLARVDEPENQVHFPHPVGYQGLDFTAFCHFDPHQRYYVENARELLDAPGEWFLDRHTGVLTYWPERGETMRQAEVVGPRLERLLIAHGTEERPLRNLHFRGLTFSHTNWALPPEGYGGIQAGFFASRRGEWNRLPAAVEFRNAVGCRFEGNRITHVAATALSFHQRCRNNRIVGNEIADAGGNGIMVGEGHEGRKDASVTSRDNLVASNFIHHCGRDFFGCVGIWIGHTEHSVVSHNLVCNLPYTGISVGWTWNPSPTPCKGNLIEYNHIHHVMQTMADGGGIYTLGFQPGTALRGNLIHDVPMTFGRAPSNGMFIDEGSKGFLFEGNVIYRTPNGPIRYNQSRAEWHTHRDNVLLPEADAAALAKAAAARPGPEPAYRDALLGPRPARR